MGIIKQRQGGKPDNVRPFQLPKPASKPRRSNQVFTKSNYQFNPASRSPSDETIGNLSQSEESRRKIQPPKRRK